MFRLKRKRWLSMQYQNVSRGLFNWVFHTCLRVTALCCSLHFEGRSSGRAGRRDESGMHRRGFTTLRVRCWWVQLLQAGSMPAGLQSWRVVCPRNDGYPGVISAFNIPSGEIPSWGWFDCVLVGLMSCLVTLRSPRDGVLLLLELSSSLLRRSIWMRLRWSFMAATTWRWIHSLSLFQRRSSVWMRESIDTPFRSIFAPLCVTYIHFLLGPVVKYLDQPG